MPELPGKSPTETSKAPEDGASIPDASLRSGRSGYSGWWLLPNFSHLLIWWVVMIGYYVVFNSLSGRYHKGLIDMDMISDGWYVILASGVVGALYAKRLRILWFLISTVLAMLILLLMLLCLGALKNLMVP